MKNYPRVEGTFDEINWVIISEKIDGTWYDYGFDMSLFKAIRTVKLVRLKEINENYF